ARCLRTMARHNKSVYSVCISADRRIAVSGSADTTVRAWDLARGERLRTLRGHNSPVFSVCFCGSPHLVLSGSYQGTLKLWDWRTGQCIRSLGGTAPAHVAPAGGLAVSGDRDGLLSVWTVAPKGLWYAAPFLVCRSDGPALPERASYSELSTAEE
ncbi:MAG: hypothetical protein JXR94_15795, partial [Candidatus Hydrogenedentes bacterium]|nr:hypothetical protein [Candidatus Hydrogenedentota bacterium]